MPHLDAVLINATSEIGHHGCTLVNRQLKAFATDAGISIVAKIPLKADWDALAPDRFDLVIVNGEGTLHSSSGGARLISQVPNWAKVRKAPAHLINTVYQDNDHHIGDAISMFDSVYARDALSLQNLISAGVKATECPDLSLTWAPPPADRIGTQPVVMDSTIEAARQELYGLSRRLQCEYLSISARPDPNITGGNHRRLLRYYTKIIGSYLAPPGQWRTHWRSVIPEFSDFAAHLREQASLLITGRFHGAAIALCLEIPVIAVPSNARKVEALFSSLGLSHRLFPNTEALWRACKAGLLTAPYTSEELEAIRRLRATARTNAVRMMRAIARST